MKPLTTIAIAIVVGLCLSSCVSQGSTPSQPPIAAGSLDTPEAYLRRGDQYSEFKDYGKAIADYTQAIQLRSDYAEAYNNRGFAYSLIGKLEMDNAIADYTQAIKLRPDYANAYNNRGVAYMASGHPDDALSDFDRAIQLQPDFPQAYSNRGNAFAREGRIDQAISDFYHAGTFNSIVIAFSTAVGVFLLVARVAYRVVQRRGLVRRWTI